MDCQSPTEFPEVQRFHVEAVNFITAGDKTAVNRLFFFLIGAGLRAHRGMEAAFLEAMNQAYREITGHDPKRGAMIGWLDIMNGFTPDLD